MTSPDARLRYLYAGLNARERALLVLRAWKERRDEDPEIRRTIPQNQIGRFNFYIAQMNAVNERLGPYLLVLDGFVKALVLRSGWLATLDFWAMDVSSLGTHMFIHLKEPITRSEYDGLQKAAAAEIVPLASCADLLAGQDPRWLEFEHALMDGSAAGKSDPWDSIVTEKRRELEAAVTAGTLDAVRKDRRVSIRAGSFYDWLKKPVPVRPEWGLEYEVFSDNEGERVNVLREERARVRAILNRAPMGGLAGGVDGQNEKSSGDEITENVLLALQDGILQHWTELRAVEIVVSEIAEEFEGEDPMIPELREVADNLREELIRLHEGLDSHINPAPLPEPDRDDIKRVRLLMKTA